MGGNQTPQKKQRTASKPSSDSAKKERGDDVKGWCVNPQKGEIKGKKEDKWGEKKKKANHGKHGVFTNVSRRHKRQSFAKTGTVDWKSTSDRVCKRGLQRGIFPQGEGGAGLGAENQAATTKKMCKSLEGAEFRGEGRAKNLESEGKKYVAKNAKKRGLGQGSLEIKNFVELGYMAQGGGKARSKRGLGRQQRTTGLKTKKRKNGKKQKDPYKNLGGKRSNPLARRPLKKRRRKPKVASIRGKINKDGKNRFLIFEGGKKSRSKV